MGRNSDLGWGPIKHAILALAIVALFNMMGCSARGGRSNRVDPSPITTPLTVTPSQVTLALGQQQDFTISGGTAPYQGNLFFNLGTLTRLSATQVRYVASQTAAGSESLRITDSGGNQVSVSIRIIGPLQISSRTVNLRPSETFTFSATTNGATGAVTYSIDGNAYGATINSSSGLFTAPASTTPVSVRVKVTDSLNRTDIAQVSIAPPMALNVSTVTLRSGGTQAITVSGGFPPYSLSVPEGVGTISPASLTTSGGSATFTAATPTTQAVSSTLTVSDNFNRTMTVTLNIKPPVVINGPSTPLLQGNSYTFTASGGDGRYTYSLLGNYGSVTLNSTTGVLSSPTAVSASLNFSVRVTDGLGQTSDSAVSIDPAMVVSPATVTLGQQQTQLFTVSGGRGSYTFSLNPNINFGQVSGGSAAEKTYTAPSVISQNSSVVLTVADQLQRSVTATITLKTPVTLSPPPKNLFQGATHTFVATGGTGAYTYQIVGNANGCSINPTTGVFTAPASVTSNFSVTVSATDAINQTGSTTFQVKTPLVISPTEFVMNLSQTATPFTVLGGEANYTFSITQGNFATVTPQGEFRSTNQSGVVNFKVTDNLGQTVSARVIVESPLTLSPSPVNLRRGDIMPFDYSGGVTPYVFSLSQNKGTINSIGSYQAPSDWSGTETVIITDHLGARATARVNVGLFISPENDLVAAGKTKVFSVVGGRAPFTFSASPNNTNNSVGYFTNTANGTFTAKAAATAGSRTTVTITDSWGQSASTNLSVANPLGIGAPKLHLRQGEVIVLTSSGGNSSNSFSVVSGPGTITPAGSFTAGNVTAKTDTVIAVSNNLDQRAQLTVSTYPALSVSPTTKNLAGTAPLNKVTLVPTGGKSPYTYSLNGGAGQITTAGVYTAPSNILSASTVRITVTDNIGQTVDASIHLKTPVQLASVSSPVKGGVSQTLTASGGDGAYTFSITSGATGGTLSDSSPANTATKVFNSATNLTANVTVNIQVRDVIGQTASRSIVVVPPVRLSAPNPSWMKPGDPAQIFTASLGQSPYTFSLVESDGGSLSAVANHPEQRSFTPLLPAGREFNYAVNLRVTDQLGQTAQQAVVVVAPLNFHSNQFQLLSGEKSFLLEKSLNGAGKHPLTFRVLSGNAGTVAVKSTQDSIVVLRCSPAPLGTLNPPIYPKTNRCPSGQVNLGSLTFSRTTSPIWHVNLGPRPGFPNRGWIYTTNLDAEQLGADERTGQGTYQISYDTLLTELNRTPYFYFYMFESTAGRTGRVVVEAKDGLNQIQNFTFDVLPPILPSPTPMALNYPTTTTVDSSGNIFVVDSLNHRVVKHSPSGAYLGSFGTLGSGPGQLNVPWGIAISSSGFIYVSDQYNHRISVFNSSLQYQSSFGTMGTANGQFSYPRGLSFDSSGNLYVADTNNHRIQKFTSAGAHLMTISQTGLEPTAFFQPSFVLTENNALYVCDKTRVYKFSISNNLVTETRLIGTPGVDYREPSAVTPQRYPFGDLVLDSANNRVIRITPTGATPFTLPTGANNYGVLNTPISIYSDSLSFTVFIVEARGNRVQIFNLFGK